MLYREQTKIFLPDNLTDLKGEIGDGYSFNEGSRNQSKTSFTLIKTWSMHIIIVVFETDQS